MIGKKQHQEAQSGSLAIQSGGNTTINTGISTDNMREIISAITQQLPVFAKIAADIAEERISKFEEKIVSRFSTDPEVETKAFEDPDFQILLRDAQRDYVRSGDSDVLNRLSELIAARSKHSARSRQSMTINRSINIASQLTNDEISVISAIFSIRMVKFTSVRNIKSLALLLQTLFEKFISLSPIDDFCYLYLESVGCGQTSIGSCEIEDALIATYPEACSVFATKNSIDESLAEILDYSVRCGIVEISDNDIARYTISDFELFKAAYRDSGAEYSDEVITRLRNALQPVICSPTALRELLRTDFPEVDQMFDKWNNSKLSKFEINAAAIAIAHVSLKQNIEFSAPLSVWVN